MSALAPLGDKADRLLIPDHGVSASPVVPRCAGRYQGNSPSAPDGLSAAPVCRHPARTADNRNNCRVGHPSSCAANLSPAGRLIAPCAVGSFARHGCHHPTGRGYDADLALFLHPPCVRLQTFPVAGDLHARDVLGVPAVMFRNIKTLLAIRDRAVIVRLLLNACRSQCSVDTGIEIVGQ